MSEENPICKGNGIYHYKNAKCRQEHGTFIMFCDYESCYPTREIILEDVEIEISDNKTIIRGNEVHQHTVENYGDREFEITHTEKWTAVRRAKYEDACIEEVEIKVVKWDWQWPFRHVSKCLKERMKDGWCVKKIRSPFSVMLSNGGIFYTKK